MSLPILLDLELQQGAFLLQMREQFSASVLGLVGPSGAGKTTMLETIAGLRRPSRGEIRIGTRILFASATGVNVPARQRRVGYVPQDLALFPHLTVRQNVLYGHSKNGKVPIDQVATILDIAEVLDRREVSSLSGGERQRVALARALMSSPELLMLDEPLTGIDHSRRERILEYLHRVRDEFRVPMIYVTHEREDVLRLADTVLVLENGRVVQSGRPQEVL